MGNDPSEPSATAHLIRIDPTDDGGAHVWFGDGAALFFATLATAEAFVGQWRAAIARVDVAAEARGMERGMERAAAMLMTEYAGWAASAKIRSGLGRAHAEDEHYAEAFRTAADAVRAAIDPTSAR